MNRAFRKFHMGLFFCETEKLDVTNVIFTNFFNLNWNILQTLESVNGPMKSVKLHRDVKTFPIILSACSLSRIFFK